MDCEPSPPLDWARFHPFDQLIQAEVPVLVVPHYGALPPLAIGRHRFLLASRGLLLEAQPLWGHLILPLWTNPRAIPLPYGEVRPGVSFRCARIPSAVIEQCLQEATAAALADREWTGWVTWSPTAGHAYVPVPHEATATWCHMPALPPLGPQEALVLDLHSHGALPAAFSDIDNRDDVGGIKVAGVLGEFDPHTGWIWCLSLRLCVEGFFFRLPNPLRLLEPSGALIR